MTNLIELHAPQQEIRESLGLRVEASPAEVLEVIDGLDVAGGPLGAVEVLGRSRHARLFRFTWHPTPGAAGRIDVVWDLRVEPEYDGGSRLSSTRRFTASDGAARRELRAHSDYIHTSADAITRRSLRALKRAAERRAAAATIRPQAELLLAA